MEGLDGLRSVAAEMDVDAVILVPGANFTRVAGQAFHGNERPLLLVVPSDRAPAAIVPSLEMESWGHVHFEGDVFAWRDQDGYQAAFDALLEAVPLRRVAVEGQVMRVFVHHALQAASPGLEIIDGERQISELRICKTAAEIAGLEAAIGVSERALSRVLDGVRPGQTEKEIERALIQALFAEGADGLSFGPIVAAGRNSALPHAHAREDYPVQPGDALLLDFGARREGMAADITRTVFVGHATDLQREVYDTVLAANAAGHAAARPGVTAHDIDDAVTNVLEASRFADRILHKTGHGLGREVHEAPYIMRGNAEIMKPGMVFTNEPGLYDTDDFGVRIEDDVLVTQGGSRSLTSFPKDLLIVGAT